MKNSEALEVPQRVQEKPISTPADAVSLSLLERSLIQEALLLLIDTRRRALELVAETCRQQQIAVPNVHDFHLPTTLHLLRRLSSGGSEHQLV